MAVSQPAERHASAGHERSGGKRLVADVMTAGVVTAHVDAPVKEIAAAMARNRISAVPVIDAGRSVVGVVTAMDLLQHFATEPHRTRPRRTRARVHLGRSARRPAEEAPVATAQAVMTPHPITVQPQTTIADAARLATDRHLHFLPVVADGVLAGCVTGSDLAKVYVRPDDEIRAEVENQVICEQMLLQPGTLGAEVTEGIVTLTGRLGTPAEAAQLVERVAAVPGVLHVRNRVTYREDRAES